MIALALLLAVILVPPVFIGLVALIPPLRKIGQHDPRTRRMEILLIGLVCFVIYFGLWTYLNAQLDYMFPNFGNWEGPPPPYPHWETDWAAEKPALVREFWVRALFPPPLRRPCYTSAVNICRIADYLLDTMFYWSPGQRQTENQVYWTLVGFAVLSALLSGAVAWFVTRPGKLLKVSSEKEITT